MAFIAAVEAERGGARLGLTIATLVATFEGEMRDPLLVRSQRIPARMYSLTCEDLLGPLA